MSSACLITCWIEAVDCFRASPRCNRLRNNASARGTEESLAGTTEIISRVWKSICQNEAVILQHRREIKDEQRG